MLNLRDKKETDAERAREIIPGRGKETAKSLRSGRIEGQEPLVSWGSVVQDEVRGQAVQAHGRLAVLHLDVHSAGCVSARCWAIF